MSKIKILIAAHKKTPILHSEVFTPIHVGRKGADSTTKEELKNYIGDDTGANISGKNAQYAEVTALYWAWKNLPDDIEYVGLMHYGRFFNFSETFYSHPENIFHNLSSDVITKFSLEEPAINELCEKYDLIIPEEWEMRKEHIKYEHDRYQHIDKEAQRRLEKVDDVLNMYDHYILAHVKEDIDMAINIINNDYPDIASFAEKSLIKTKARFTNMFVMRRDLFNGYCAFLFDIFTKMEGQKGYYNNSIYEQGSFHSRIFGFLAERLFSIYLDFIINQPNIKYLEKQIVFADYKKMEVKNSDYDATINIVMSCDDNYAKYLAVAINSIISNAHKKGNVFHFYILDGGIREKNKKRIMSFVNKQGSKIEFIEIDLQKFKETCPLSEDVSHITIPTYFRFSIPRMLPHTLDKVLYLDVDLIANAPLNELYNMDLGESYAIAVEDTFSGTQNIACKLGLSGKYINAGVMLINLGKWRNENIENLLFANIDKIREHIIFVDQDVLNFTLSDKVKYISYQWNLQQTAYHMTKSDINLTSLEVDKQNPKIIHYSGHIKPWDISFHCWHPLVDTYFPYWKSSPYKMSYHYFRFKKNLFSLFLRLFGRHFEYYHLKKEKLRGMFNDRFYLNTYPDVLQAGMNPLFHYCKYGWKEGRNPSSEFNTTFYLNSNPDVKKSGMNPLFHYLVYGIKEQRKPNE